MKRSQARVSREVSVRFSLQRRARLVSTADVNVASAVPPDVGLKCTVEDVPARRHAAPTPASIRFPTLAAEKRRFIMG